VRDLDRIREVRRFSLTAGQLVSLAASAVAFAGGCAWLAFTAGRLHAPIDPSLLAPESPGDGDGALARLQDSSPEDGALTVGDDTRPGPPHAATAGAAGTVDAASPSTALAAAVATPRAAETLEPAAPPEDLEALSTREAPPEATAPTRSPPATTPSPTPAPAAARPLPPPPAGKGFTVQIGAYESVDEARSVIASLAERGLPVFHQEASVDGRTWHRVRVGLYDQRADADAAAARLGGATPFTPFVTRQP
jgi:cell division septation protein DedD